MHFKILIILLVCFLNYGYGLKLGTPYHSFNENNFEEVANLLNTPVQIANYIVYNFKYVNDRDQYKKPWAVSSKTMFYRKTGDCEDYAEFAKDVLKRNGYFSDVYVLTYNTKFSHAIAVYKDSNTWGYIDCSGEILYRGFSSLDQLLNNTDKGNLVSTSVGSDFFSIDDYSVPNNIKKNRVDTERIELHSYLTRCSDGVYFFSPGIGGKSYLSSLHKISFGVLAQGIGFSMSTHGYYANNTVSQKVYSGHFLFLNRRLGISPYIGKMYTGVNLDLKLLDYKYIRSFVCVRNFGEVVDALLTIYPAKWISISLEKLDKDICPEISINLSNSFSTDIALNKIKINMSSNVLKLSLSYDFYKTDVSDIQMNIRF